MTAKKILVAATVALIALLMLVIATSSALAGSTKLSGPNGEHKVVVCKYVGTPGVDERLQTGQNPIVVDYHSLLGDGFNGTFPFAFSDAQGKSVAVQWTFDEHFSDLSVCPAPQGCVEDCGPTAVVPVPPVDTAATCDTAETVAVPDQPEGVVVSVDGSTTGPGTVTITFSAAEGFTLGDAQTVYTFDLAGASGDCGGGGGHHHHHHHGGHHQPPSVPKAPTLKQYKQDVQNGAEPGGG